MSIHHFFDCCSFASLIKVYIIFQFSTNKFIDFYGDNPYYVLYEKEPCDLDSADLYVFF